MVGNGEVLVDMLEDFVVDSAVREYNEEPNREAVRGKETRGGSFLTPGRSSVGGKGVL